MKITTKNRILILITILLALSLFKVDAFTTNGTEKTFDFAITSGKNNEISSENFNAALVIGDITNVANSSNFRAEVGFLRTTGYVTGEACGNNLECTGGFCCSNVCQSTSCPAEEEEDGAASTGGGAAAGGGGGGFVPAIDDFSIDTELIMASILQGAAYNTEFTIKNTGAGNLSFDLDISALDELLFLSEYEFLLAPNVAKTIDVVIFSGKKKKPDIYTGNIKITANEIIKFLPVVIEIEPKEALFDIKVIVSPKHKYVLKTESVIANITLTNVGDLKPVDVELYYALRDVDGRNLTYGIETRAIYDKISMLKELRLPDNISFGTYLFYAKVSYGTETAVAVDIFQVVEVKPVSCFDGIQNQEEKGIDCSGPCKPCKFRFIDVFKSIPLPITLGLIIIIFLVITFVIFENKHYKKERHKRKHHRIHHKERHHKKRYHKKH